MRINEEAFAEKCDQEKTILFSKMLTVVDYDQQASEIYQTFINEHAEYRFKSHYYVKKEEGEEDYYGHFGGEKRYIIIVKD